MKRPKKTQKRFENDHFHNPYSFILLGLFGLIQIRQQLLGTASKPIILLAPGEIQSWLEYYDTEIEPILGEIEFIDNKTLVGLHSFFAIHACLKPTLELVP